MFAVVVYIIVWRTKESEHQREKCAQNRFIASIAHIYLGSGTIARTRTMPIVHDTHTPRLNVHCSLAGCAIYSASFHLTPITCSDNCRHSHSNRIDQMFMRKVLASIGINIAHTMAKLNMCLPISLLASHPSRQSHWNGVCVQWGDSPRRKTKCAPKRMRTK